VLDFISRNRHHWNKDVPIFHFPSVLMPPGLISTQIFAKKVRDLNKVDLTNMALSTFRNPVESCTLNEPTWKAYRYSLNVLHELPATDFKMDRQLSHKEVSALAVTNNAGVLVGCLSVSDLKVDHIT